jgi:6-phosphogluconolactonase (cycloisomerase 2 family)
MRMTFNKTRQLLVASAASLLAAGLMTACGTLTTDFVFVTSAKAAGSYNYGEIDVFEINAVSGAMRQIPTSPFPSGGRNPVAEAVSSDNASLYVVNQDDNNIVQFKIGSDGKLYAQNTVNTPGIYPLAVAVNGAYLYVLDTYQPLTTCSSAAPCSGSIGVFPIGSGNELGTAIANGSKSYWPLSLTGANSGDILLPTGIHVSTSGSNTYVYVTAYDSTAKKGYVFVFQSNSGSLTAVSGSPFAAGTHPSAVASDSTGSYVYVTDYTNANVLAYSVASGVLTKLGTYSTGNEPSAIVADSKYQYLYVANAQDGTVSAYQIVSGGTLKSIATYDAGIQPVAIGIDPSTYHFLFTVNFLGNDVSDFELNTGTGTLVSTQHSPYASNSEPTAVAAIPHGSAKN